MNQKQKDLLSRNANNEQGGLNCFGQKRFIEILEEAESKNKTATFEDDLEKIDSVKVVFK